MSLAADGPGRVHRGYAWARLGQIHYRRSGPAGARSPLLLLHAGTTTGAPFEDFMSEMGRERTVIAPDLPGAGMSDPLGGAGGAADAAGAAGALLEVVAELGLGMVDVAAVGDGGEVAVEMARQRPEVVRKIVLISAPAPRGLLGQPTLALDMPGFPGTDDEAAASLMRSFLDR